MSVRLHEILLAMVAIVRVMCHKHQVDRFGRLLFVHLQSTIVRRTSPLHKSQRPSTAVPSYPTAPPHPIAMDLPLDAPTHPMLYLDESQRCGTTRRACQLQRQWEGEPLRTEIIIYPSSSVIDNHFRSSLDVPKILDDNTRRATIECVAPVTVTGVVNAACRHIDQPQFCLATELRTDEGEGRLIAMRTLNPDEHGRYMHVFVRMYPMTMEPHAARLTVKQDETILSPKWIPQTPNIGGHTWLNLIAESNWHNRIQSMRPMCMGGMLMACYVRELGVLMTMRVVQWTTEDVQLPYICPVVDISCTDAVWRFCVDAIKRVFDEYRTTGAVYHGLSLRSFVGIRDPELSFCIVPGQDVNMDAHGDDDGDYPHVLHYCPLDRGQLGDSIRNFLVSVHYACESVIVIERLLELWQERVRGVFERLNDNIDIDTVEKAFFDVVNDLLP